MTAHPFFTRGETRLSQGDRREILVDEHRVLRRQIEELRDHAGRLLAGKENATSDLIRSLDALQSLFRAHLDHEEALLDPLLEKIDAWGPIRLERLHAEHAHQREWLLTLRASMSAHLSIEELARHAYALIEALSTDMAHEEKDLFSVLSDDVVQLDPGEN